MGVSFFRGWMPLHRIPVLTNLWGGAGKFGTIAAGRRWSILLIRHDPTAPAVPTDERPTLRQAMDDADVNRALSDVVRDHNATYHPGRGCHENQYVSCVDRFGTEDPGKGQS